MLGQICGLGDQMRVAFSSRVHGRQKQIRHRDFSTFSSIMLELEAFPSRKQGEWFRLIRFPGYFQ